jgi:hypothetical protein
VGGERQSLIDVELARTEFRLDVLKLRKQLSEIGIGKDPDGSPPAVAVVTTPQGTTIEPAGESKSTSPEPASSSAREMTAGSA